MPLYEYLCVVCQEMQERYIPADTPRPDTVACRGCDGAAAWAGLSVCKSQFPQPTGAYTTDGRFVEGRWGQDAKTKKKRLTKTYL